MVIISPVDDLASSHPLAADAAAGASQPPASNPESLFDDFGTAAYVAGTRAWSAQPPPYAPTATTSSGGYNSSSSPLLFGSMMDPAPPPPVRIMQPAMAEPSYYYHYPQTQLGFPPCFAPAPFAQGAMPPPVLVPMQTTRVDHAVPDTQKAEETTTTTTPRRRGRPRKTATASKPAFKPPKRATAPAFKPPKRATARSNRATSQRRASATDPATMAGQVQVQKPIQAASVVAVASSNQTAPCTNPMALFCQEQWQLQSTSSNSLSAGDQAAVAAQEVMVPYADTSPAGVRFQPTDEELIFYLRLKHAGVQKMPVDFFTDVDVYHVHPETTKAACGESVDEFWYAFSPRNRKYKNGDRPARSVFEASGEQVGYWKSNIKLAPVHVGGKDDGALIGKVTSLTFHLGRQPNGTQTPWKMKEYAIPENQHAPDGSAMRLNDWVVCKLFYKERVIAAQQEDQLGEAGGENFGRTAGGDEGTQMVSTDQTLGNSEQDLCVEDYLGYGETFAQQNHAAN